MFTSWIKQKTTTTEVAFLKRNKSWQESKVSVYKVKITEWRPVCSKSRMPSAPGLLIDDANAVLCAQEYCNKEKYARRIKTTSRKHLLSLASLHHCADFNSLQSVCVSFMELIGSQHQWKIHVLRCQLTWQAILGHLYVDWQPHSDVDDQHDST